MVYNKINKLRKKQRNQSLLADAIGMTVQGVNLMMKKKTMTVETLEKIAKYFEVSPASFYEEDESSLHDLKRGVKCRNVDCLRLEAQLDLLTKILKEKDEEIAKLNREVGHQSSKMSKESN